MAQTADQIAAVLDCVKRAFPDLVSPEAKVAACAVCLLDTVDPRGPKVETTTGRNCCE